MPFKQDARIGRLTTVLGKDSLVLLRFSGGDRMNGLFDCRMEALATGHDVDFDALIGTHAMVESDTQNNGPRAFDGIVVRTSCAGTGENGNRYDLVLRPWAWLAGRRRNQRIFHDMTAPQILNQLLGAHAGLGDPHLRMRLTQDYPILEYTVQHGKTGLDVATRLMERFGVSHPYSHAMVSHIMVLTDDVESHEVVAGGGRVFRGVDGHHFSDEEHFWALHPERNLTTGAVRLTDYSFKTPNAAMEVDRTGDAAHAEGRIESFDYPGDFLDQGEGRGTVRRRMEEERGHDRRFHAEGDVTSLKAGMVVELTGEPTPGLPEARMLCLVARRSYVSEGYGTSDRGSDGYAYSGKYVLTPVDAPMRPDRKTPRPIMKGPQTAAVVSEGEIDCDEYGRILVRFHWDLDNSISMRCRVSQNWAS
ncbi:type VI secretion system Vgr family protein [Jannaschia rubra]|uniref:Type VI secretion system Vgr family protein n=1 Tax=Jannaschia rubra TaxID=282197 RepID=A0A0M6XR59_9RHOB|nr:type VI secretion system tip protein TssI/VgrG [Jannaschia rubra]CTQ33358.1 type VI secretion system Vgr family protein [Jannaschia rubra]SFF99916.1 Rhs element Vgr protein [Jannaschia rubra]